MKFEEVHPTECDVSGTHNEGPLMEQISTKTWDALMREIVQRNQRIKDAVKETDACQNGHRRASGV